MKADLYRLSVAVSRSAVAGASLITARKSGAIGTGRDRQSGLPAGRDAERLSPECRPSGCRRSTADRIDRPWIRWSGGRCNGRGARLAGRTFHLDACDERVRRQRSCGSVVHPRRQHGSAARACRRAGPAHRNARRCGCEYGRASTNSGADGRTDRGYLRAAVVEGAAGLVLCRHDLRTGQPGVFEAHSGGIGLRSRGERTRKHLSSTSGPLSGVKPRCRHLRRHRRGA